MDKIDILMATYNGEKYISNQIESIINQTYSNWELIIRDDGSKDDTLNIIKKYQEKDKRIKILDDNKKNLGFNKNFEELMNQSKASYIMFCDQDDVWMSQKLEKTYKEMKESELKEVPTLVHSDSLVVDERLNIISDHFVSRRAVTKGLRGVIFANCVQGSTIMINESLKKKALPFITPMNYDHYLAILTEMLGQRIFINENLMYYRQHGNNAIGGGLKNQENKNRMESFLEKFDSKIYLMAIGDREEIKKIQNKFINETSFDKLKIISDYLVVVDQNTNRFLKIFLFIKNRFILHRKVEYINYFTFLLKGKKLS